ncbi:hypothetical protein [Paenibacillus sp. FJAT-27812]|uniref:hypothetical protein n=1 Tax=Paenibacillus sp. FJAT-27812 TaxID=1684143 RepID=UPI0006A7B033|nr:hypothetical protein [Paenibacillus sp. FJAT-27812]
MMKKMGLSFIVLVMLLAFASSASAANRVETGTYSHGGGNLYVYYSAYDSHVSGYLNITIYRVTSSGDVFITSYSEEGGRPGHDMHQGTLNLGNQPAGTYKFVASNPDSWMGPSVSFHN